MDHIIDKAKNANDMLFLEYPFLEHITNGSFVEMILDGVFL